MTIPQYPAPDRERLVLIERAYLYRVENRTYAAPLDEFENTIGENLTEIVLLRFSVISKTPKGYWIHSYGGSRFVRMDAKKKFACETMQDAFDSFKARKKKEMRIYQVRIRNLQKCLDALKNGELLQSLDSGNMRMITYQPVEIVVA